MELALKKKIETAAPLVLYDSRETIENGDVRFLFSENYSSARIESIQTRWPGRNPPYSNGYMIYLSDGSSYSPTSVRFTPHKDLTKYHVLKISYHNKDGSDTMVIRIYPYEASPSALLPTRSAALPGTAYNGYSEFEFDISGMEGSGTNWIIDVSVAGTMEYGAEGYIHRLSIE